MSEKRVFDMPHTVTLTKARMDFLNRWLPKTVRSCVLKTALDTGCGLGDFSRYLRDLGLEVTAFDGRLENVEEARKRHPDVAFRVGNVEDPDLLESGSFDLVFWGLPGLVWVIFSLLLTVKAL